jgi:hypothetical protein
MKKLIKRTIIFLCRNDYTLEKLRKYNLYSIFIFIFLLLTIGISWNFSMNGSNIKFNMHINLITWWTLVMLQNACTLFLYLYRTNLSKVCDEYVSQLLKEKNVTVGYPDSKFTTGQIFKVEEDSIKMPAGLFRGMGRYTTPKDGIFNGYYAGQEVIEQEKIFKFISSQKNRKMKLQKLANLTK